MFLRHTSKIFKDEIVFLMNIILLNCFLIAGLEILAFPCNQFGGQERGSNPEIKQFACTRFKAEFPIFDKYSSSLPVPEIECWWVFR